MFQLLVPSKGSIKTNCILDLFPRYSLFSELKMVMTRVDKLRYQHQHPVTVFPRTRARFYSHGDSTAIGFDVSLLHQIGLFPD